MQFVGDISYSVTILVVLGNGPDAGVPNGAKNNGKAKATKLICVSLCLSESSCMEHFSCHHIYIYICI